MATNEQNDQKMTSRAPSKKTYFFDIPSAGGGKYKHYLVAGGSGFIGSHLCRSLLEEVGVRVICVDNLCSGRLKNIKELEKNENFIFIYHDITKHFEIGVRIDKIFHLACMASPKFYQKDPMKTLDACYVGTKNLLEKAAEHRSRMLFTSTSEVYGDPLVSVQPESYLGNVNTTGPRACYDEGKRIAETLCMTYKKLYGTDVCVARIFNTYGERMSPRDGRVVSNIITQCLRGEDITIYGDGKQTRSFCYISDQVRGLKLLMDSKETGPINIGNPEEINILTLAEKIKNLAGGSSDIKFLDLPEGDPAIRRPDITLAKNLLSWAPIIGLEEGLSRTIDFNRANEY